MTRDRCIFDRRGFQFHHLFLRKFSTKVHFVCFLAKLSSFLGVTRIFVFQYICVYTCWLCRIRYAWHLQLAMLLWLSPSLPQSQHANKSGRASPLIHDQSRLISTDSFQVVIWMVLPVSILVISVLHLAYFFLLTGIGKSVDRRLDRLALCEAGCACFDCHQIFAALLIRAVA